VIDFFLQKNREEPSLETWWFINKETMEKVQNLKNTFTNTCLFFPGMHYQMQAGCKVSAVDVNHLIFYT
jgi:hypothetical protein